MRRLGWVRRRLGTGAGGTQAVGPVNKKKKKTIRSSKIILMTDYNYCANAEEVMDRWQLITKRDVMIRQFCSSW